MSFDALGDSLGDLNINDKDVMNALQQEQQKLQFQAQVLKITDMCWEKCYTDKPSTKLDGRTESCLSNCVERFIDASVAIQKRFGQMLEKQMSSSLD
ncbi:Mitochondrial import inner membrane translocase subunit Tim8 [Halotydeus destructor]|nr:Mitochondrial import inner membrane translocase subunit Tim8 [Halotydeus destructor]